MCHQRTHFAMGIAISMWTVVQTSVHIVLALSGYYSYNCKLKPSHYWLVIPYLTYFYKENCGDIILDDELFFADLTNNKTRKRVIEFGTSVTEQEDVHSIIQTILEKAQLPKESSQAWRTHLYLTIFIVCDGVWLITAFLLFAATFYQVKKCISLLFYCPWLITTGFVIIFDVVSAVHFGLDILLIYNYTSWLKFIGVVNYKNFSDLNAHNNARIVSTSASIGLCLLFSRFLVFWITNIVNFFQILTIASIAFQDNLDENRTKKGKKRSNCRSSVKRDSNLNTSETRIRNWQLFYGAIETTSTANSGSSRSNSRNNNHNSITDRSSALILANTDCDSRRQLDVKNDYMSPTNSESQDTLHVNTHYRRFPDVADVLDDPNAKTTHSTRYSRSQVPCSQIKIFSEGETSHNTSKVPTTENKIIRRVRSSDDNRIGSTAL